MTQIGTPKPSTSGRLEFLDWTRGAAVLIILQGHVFHSFSKPSLHNDAPYAISQFFGGVAPAIFLLLTGITLGFIMHGSERKGLSPRGRWIVALRRGGYLFLIAFLFRLQLWVFGYPDSPTPELLRVDVLNCMGFAIVLMSLLAFLTTEARARTAAIGFFPWASFIAFGVSLGSILRLTKQEQMNRVMQWVALAGFVLFFGGQYCSTFPYSLYSHEEFWLNSPWMVAMKLGPVLLLIVVAYLWNEYGSKGWSPLRQFGVTSLLVYWVHIELVYGRWLWFLRENLNAAQCAVAAIILMALMLGLSVLRTRYKGRPLPSFSFSFPYITNTQPRRVSGD
jgi:uncharacterized membrane protein